MRYEALNADEYISKLPEGRREAVVKLRETVKDNLPEGFEEVFSYGMIGYAVPLSLYPPGYHAKPGEPLPFMNIASQKNHIALYHMGIYLFDGLLSWFEGEYAAYMHAKPDMGKSCIRFKNEKNIPYPLIAELCAKITPEAYIEKYVKSAGL
jgi:uncharacterized protein YdhG (YjbR/CyaY superfamily)